MSKGGTTSGSTEIPKYLEDAAKENINRARDVAQIGYTPYYGPDVAAFSPLQQQSMQSTGNAASAFGLAPQGFNAMAGMPQAQTFAGGVQGYSSAPLYEQSLDKLFANAPAQYNAINNMFIDPFTGARARNGGYGYASPVNGMARTGDGGGGNVSPTPPQWGTSGAYVGEGMTDTVNIGGVNYPNTLPPSQGLGDGENFYNGNGELMGTMDALGNIIKTGIASGPVGSIYELLTGDALFNSRGVPVTERNIPTNLRGGKFTPPWMNNDGFVKNTQNLDHSDSYISGRLGGLFGAAINPRDLQREEQQRFARQEADQLNKELAMQNYKALLQTQESNMAPILKRVQAASPTVAALRASVNDGPQWSPSVNNSDAGAPQASYSNTGQNNYNFGL